MLIQKRNDAVGLFWEDWTEKREPAVKVKREPPERTWERPDYLPGLEAALAFDVDLFTDEELIQACKDKHRLVYDIECYPNYFLVMFRSLENGKIVYFEMYDDGFMPPQMNIAKLQWIVDNFTLVGFNSINYDAPILALALAGKDNAAMQSATERIIVMEEQPWMVLRAMKVKQLKFDHIDLIEVAPLSASLKAYAGRLHTKKMQDLPFVPGTELSPEQMAIVRFYCCNDLNSTVLLYNELAPAIKLREDMSKEYGVDLRSKSDAQVAEAVIAHELERMSGQKPQRPTITPGSSFLYNVPSFMGFTTPNLQWVLDLVRRTRFYVGFDGTVTMPPELAELRIPIGDNIYTMGIGGLHSSESHTCALAGPGVRVLDRDVASYYPSIILNQGLFPAHLGPAFLTVYRAIVQRRLEAKKTGNKLVADSLKITINGSFGKLGSPYSVLYSPNLLIQVTLTGQLCLLMLVEAFTEAGIYVYSANTDGIVIKCREDQEELMLAIVKWWETLTQYETEETEYKALYSRDVNNYIAVKKDGSFKAKGAYTEKGSAGNSRLSKNPAALIASDAVVKLLTEGIPIEKTICECKDITRFVVVRSVKGGAVKDGEYLGKTVRWYYSTAVPEDSEIIYARSGNKVPRSEGAKPCMELPEEFPEDMNFAWYETEAHKILEEIGYA